MVEVGLRLASRQNQNRVLPGRHRRGSAEHTVVYVPWVHVFRARRALNKNEVVFHLPRFSLVSKDALKKMGQWRYVGGGCIGVLILQLFADLARMINPCRAGVDELLLVLPVGVVHAARAHQHLFGALGPQETQTVSGLPVKSKRDGNTSPRPIPATSLTWAQVTHPLVTQDDTSRVTGDCFKHGSVRARGCDSPGLLDPGRDHQPLRVAVSPVPAELS